MTAYHYTTGAGFNRIVARFETESGEMPDSQDFAEEVWDRPGGRGSQTTRFGVLLVWQESACVGLHCKNEAVEGCMLLARSRGPSWF